MRAGLVIPFFDAAEVAEAARLAESHGWDGVFLAESVWGMDAWIALTAAAMRASRIRLGTMLTPLARYKPWDVASRVGTLDRLSGGRVQLTVGLGALYPGWTAFEPDTGRAERALLLDEGLAVYDGLMRGQPFSFVGQRYTVQPTVVPPAGARAAESPAELAEIVAAARTARTAAGLPWDGYDVITEGVTPADHSGLAMLHQRILAGPPTERDSHE